MHTRHILAATAAAALAIGCGREPTGPPDAQAPAVQGPHFDQTAVQGLAADDLTPFQRRLMQTLAERRAHGLPVPDSVSYSFTQQAAESPGAMRMMAPGAGGGTSIEATTRILFGNPEQAGLGQWPALQVRGALPQGATGFVNEGDYTDEVRRQIAAQYPNANVDLANGPRTLTVTETITDKSASEPASLNAMADAVLLGQTTTTAGLLMGFTIPGPGLDYHIEYNLSVCVFWLFGCHAEWDIVDFWAGFVLDWTIATRLPMEVSLTSPDPVEEGSTFTPVTAATGRDWTAGQYTAAGVSALDGNEFVLHFEFGIGVFLTVSYIPVVNYGIPPMYIDSVASFATPLGPGATFALPGIDLSIWNLDVSLATADFGARLSPQVGSDRYTADWAASGEGTGSGSVTYTTSGEEIALGTIQAAEGPGTVAVELSGFQYHLTQFLLDLGLYFNISVAGWEDDWTIPITQFDLGSVTGGLYLGTHGGTPGTRTLYVPVTNVAPTATIARTGTILLNGLPTFVVPPGGSLTFTGEATDPGDDDLTLTWDWGDGTPAPDVSTTYPAPHAVTESQAHQFSTACLYQVTLGAQDDDGDANVDRVPVIVTAPGGNLARLEGWWQHQLRREGARELDDATLACYLALAAHMSNVLGEVHDIGTIPSAHDLLFMQGNAGDPRPQFDRELLVVWLNFAHGAIGYTELVDADGNGVADTPFAEVVAAAEAARLNPATTAAQLRRLTGMLHHISEQATT